MSLKDDFLEALRSVKRDFFRESEYTGQDQSARTASEPAAQHTTDFNKAFEAASVQPKFTMESGDPDAPVSPPGQSDDAVFEAFRQASAISDYSDYNEMSGDEPDRELHAGERADPIDTQYADVSGYEENEENDDDIPGDTTPYRSFVPASVDMETSGSRRIMNFDDNGLDDDNKTIISKNTIIRGTLQTDDSVRLLGQVLGDIECKSNIVVAGKVRGNTTAANAYIFDAQVDGDVRCDDVVNVSNDAWVLGNIRAQQAEINGKIKGNIEIRHTVSIGESSSVLGDISTDELEIKRGAFINGQVMMYSPSRDVLDRFDRFQE